jgi:hypothetical protein
MGSLPLSGPIPRLTVKWMVSCRPLMEDEGIFNLSSGTRFLRRLGYRITQPSDIIISIGLNTR